MSISTGRAHPALWFSLVFAALASLFAVSSAPSAAAAEPVPINAGAGADWGVKASFRAYIAGPIANGTTEVSDGASVNPDGTFHFPVASGAYDPDTRSAVVQFGGSVHFSGHAGQLDLQIWSPRVEITPEGAALYAEVTSRSLEDGAPFVHYANAKLANLDLSAAEPLVDGTTTTWSALPTTLDQEGIGPFAGFYGAGTALDPLSFGYEGPGGKPEAEKWTAPGTPLLGLAATGSVPSGVGHLAIGPGGRVWASSYDGESLSVLDGDSLATLATIDVEHESRNVVVDKAADAAYSIGTDIRRVNDASGAPVLDPTALSLGIGVASNELAVRESDGALFTIYGFRLHRLTPLAGGGRQDDSWELSSDYTRVKVTPDGQVMLYGSALATVTFNGADGATITPIPGTAGAGNVAFAADGTLVWIKLDGSAYPVITSQLVVMHPDGSGGYTTETHPAGSAWGTIATAVSADGKRFIATDQGGTKFVIFEEGEAVATVSGPTLANDVAIAPDGTAYMSWRSGLVGKLGQVGTSPTVTAQPVDAEVELASADGSAAASFATGASGVPAPAIQWQRRVPGATRWTAIDGETSPTLTVEATQAAAGTRYRAVFSNEAGSIASEPASLRVVVSTRGEVPPTTDDGGGSETPGGDGGGGDSATPASGAPAARPFRLATPRRVLLAAGGGAAVVAKVDCVGSQACRLRVPARVRLRAGEESYAAKVVAPRRIAPGSRGAVRLRIGAPTRAALAGRRVEARFQVRLSVAGTLRKSVVHPVLVFPGKPRGSGRQG